jgi:hypothetical protein
MGFFVFSTIRKFGQKLLYKKKIPTKTAFVFSTRMQ